MSLSLACQLLFQHVLKSRLDALAKQGADTPLTLVPLSCSFSFRHMVLLYLCIFNVLFGFVLF